MVYIVTVAHCGASYSSRVFVSYKQAKKYADSIKAICNHCGQEITPAVEEVW